MTTKTSKSVHSPLPWHIASGITGRSAYIWQVGNDYSAKIDNNDVGVAIASGMNAKEAEANAQFIVRAVNNHESLLSACKWALPLVVQWFNEKPHCQDHSGLTALRDAITKAEADL